MFYQDVTIDHCTHVPSKVYQSSYEIEYNAAWTSGMTLAHIRVQNKEFLNKDKYVVTEQAPLIILDRK